MIHKKNCQKIGTIIKAHGVKGEVIVQFNIDIFELLKETESIFIEVDGYLVPFFLENVRTKTEIDYLLKFNDLDQKTLDQIIEKDIYLPKEKINIVKTDFNPVFLKGYMLFDEKKMQVGEILDFMDIPGNPNLVVSYLKSEILIPFNDELIIALDEEKRNIIMIVPDGLLELY